MKIMSDRDVLTITTEWKNEKEKQTLQWRKLWHTSSTVTSSNFWWNVYINFSFFLYMQCVYSTLYILSAPLPPYNHWQRSLHFGWVYSSCCVYIYIIASYIYIYKYIFVFFWQTETRFVMFNYNVKSLLNFLSAKLIRIQKTRMLIQQNKKHTNSTEIANNLHVIFHWWLRNLFICSD